MLKQLINIKNLDIDIPAILWGENTGKIFIAVHGNMSNKEDDVIVIFAEEAIKKGYQVLSFDLPEHGERKNNSYACKPLNCVSDLTAVYNFAQTITKEISLFGCSMGVYFSLLSYNKLSLKQCLFLSPIVNMMHIIDNLMTSFNVSEQQLQAEGEISLPIGLCLYWDYYCYVKEHPINFAWPFPTNILYGEDDNMSEWQEVLSFSTHAHAIIKVLEHGEHYFHTTDQLNFFKQWLINNII